MKRLYLYGPPASGKTTLARKLAGMFKVEAVDLDAAIVARTGMSIPAFFAEYGEAAFRKVESETLRGVSAPVVSLGGGTLLDASNREFAESAGEVVVLDADDETIARRIAAAGGSRPLGNRLAERRAHYAGFARHAGPDAQIMLPSRLEGSLDVPVSKSHLHRLLIADFLAGGEGAPSLLAAPDECDDIKATRRCLSALAAARGGEAVLDCGESGSTLRFLAPVAAALGVAARFERRGRLAERPMMDFSGLESGEHVLRGDVSSQFATGLIFALPLLDGDSKIVFSSPLESRGYVDMTLDVVREYGIAIEETGYGFAVPGRQRYRRPAAARVPEGDWSGAAFWIVANCLGAGVEVANVSAASRQPDRIVGELVARIAAGGAEIDMSGAPDLFPALCVAAAATPAETRFVNAARLRIKESDRIAAMEKALAALGAEMHSTRDTAVVRGSSGPFASCDIDSQGDHRIAMAAAVASMKADGPVVIHGAGCAAKSYPGFFAAFSSLVRRRGAS